MVAKLFLELVSPERQLVSTEVDEIYAPGAEGDLGILPDHTALVCALRPGEFRYTIGNEVEYVAVDGGFLEVKENVVSVLVDGAEMGREINIEEALKRKLQMEKDLEAARNKEQKQYDMLQAQLMKELVRINVAGRYNQ